MPVAPARHKKTAHFEQFFCFNHLANYSIG
jgi:hypothetical protein